MEDQNFYGSLNSKESDAYLIVGFDTEFKSPDGPVSREDITAGNANYLVLSYQFHCSVYDPDRPEAKEWSGICYPQDGERLTMAELLIFAVHQGVSTGAVTGVPRLVYLVGHFNRADIPAFADFQTLTKLMSSVRSTFISITSHIPIEIGFDEPQQIGGGHANVASTARYSHLANDTLLAAVEAGVARLNAGA